MATVGEATINTWKTICDLMEHGALPIDVINAVRDNADNVFTAPITMLQQMETLASLAKVSLKYAGGALAGAALLNDVGQAISEISNEGYTHDSTLISLASDSAAVIAIAGAAVLAGTAAAPYILIVGTVASSGLAAVAATSDIGADKKNEIWNTIGNAFVNDAAAHLQVHEDVSNAYLDFLKQAFSTIMGILSGAAPLGEDKIDQAVEKANDVINNFTQMQARRDAMLAAFPVNPPSGYFISGDLTPVDFDLGVEGIQTQTDELGNVIVDPNAPDPGRNDFLLDSAGDDWIKGLGGRDEIDAQQGGNDTLEGGSGADILYGRAGNDLVFADEYGEMETLITAGETAGSINEQGDLLYGGEGDDFLYGSNSNDLIAGGFGRDLLVGGGGDDYISGDMIVHFALQGWSISYEVIPSGNTNIYSSHIINVDGLNEDEITDGGADVIYAGTGNDYVTGGRGDDEIYGGDGNDSLFGYAGHDFIEGGEGNDAIKGDAFTVPIADQGDDYIDGGGGDDKVWGNYGNDVIFGGADNDTLYGDEGDDYLDGEDGLDSLYGGAGNDVMFDGDGRFLKLGSLSPANNHLFL
jgi:Ca2+-binding RTX toxin-like protein